MIQAGSITLWVVVMLVIFAVLLTASLQFITRQSHATIIQEQEEQAFAAAEGGVHQTVWLLNSGAKTLSDLNTTTVADEPVANSNGDVVARFTLGFSGIDARGVTVLSTGRDEGQPRVCQIVQARVTRVDSGGFSITGWEHLVSTNCRPAPPVTTGGAAGSPVNPITLDNNNHSGQLQSSQIVHHYTFNAPAGTKFRFIAIGQNFTPTLKLQDSTGVVMAEAGFAHQLAHVRWTGMLYGLQESLRASLQNTGDTSPAGCGAAVYQACILWASTDAGPYYLELGSSTAKVGAFELKTEIQ